MSADVIMLNVDCLLLSQSLYMSLGALEEQPLIVAPLLLFSF